MNPVEHYKSLLERAAPTANRYLPDAEAVVADWKTRIDEQKIHIMLFGAYNAGKSTLINTLVGREVAKHAEVPTTDTVDFYEWDGHLLIDTPGVNAPIEHEEISLAQLERSDLVVFVLRQEDQDASDIMDRIFDLLERKQPLFIVLNYEDGDPRRIEEVQARFAKTLLSYAQRRALDPESLRAIPTILMNIKSACRARLEKKAVLLEHARFDVFLLRFREWLANYDGQKQRMQQICEGIDRSLLQPVARLIDKEAPPSGDMHSLDAQIEHVTRGYRLVRNAASSKIRSELALKRPKISDALAQGGSNDAVLAALTAVGESVSEVVRNWLERELKGQVKERVGSAFVADGLGVPGGDAWSGSEFGSKMLDAALQGMKGVNKDHVKTLLEFGRKLKIPGLKGRWSKTLGAWASKAAPIIQAGALVAETAVEYYGEERENQLKHDRALQRGQWVDEACSQLYSGLMQSVSDVITHVEQEELTPLSTRRDELRSKSGGVDRDRSEWMEISAEFQAVAS